MLSHPPTSFSFTITKHLFLFFRFHIFDFLIKGFFFFFWNLFCTPQFLFSTYILSVAHKNILYFCIKQLYCLYLSVIFRSCCFQFLSFYISLSLSHTHTHHPNSILIRSFSFLKELVSSKSSLLRFSALRLPDFYPLHVASIWNSLSPGRKFLHCHTLKRSDNEITLCTHT